MSLYYHEKVDSNTQLYVWRIDETEDFYYSKIQFSEFDTSEYQSISNEGKKKQWLASRFLLKQVLNPDHMLLLKKSKNGKPYFENNQNQFSISHTSEFVAVIISDHNVAIDIETIKEKSKRVERKYINPNDFLPKNLLDYTLIWSAKETLYKLYDDTSISLKLNFNVKEKLNTQLLTQVVNYKVKQEVLVSYRIFSDFVMTFIH